MTKPGLDGLCGNGSSFSLQCCLRRDLARVCVFNLRAKILGVVDRLIERASRREPSRDPFQSVVADTARLLILPGQSHREKGTEVARFLKRHSPTPSDFGWPGYPIRCREVEVAVMMRHVATREEATRLSRLRQRRSGLCAPAAAST